MKETKRKLITLKALTQTTARVGTPKLYEWVRFVSPTHAHGVKSLVNSKHHGGRTCHSTPWLTRLKVLGLVQEFLLC